MRSMWIGVVLLAGMVAAPGPAQNTDKAATKPVCRSERGTGTRIYTSECHTRAEWVEIDAARRKQAEQFQRNMSNPGGDGAISNSPNPR